MKMRLILSLLLALLALKGNLNAASIVNYGTDGDDTQMDLGTPGPTPSCSTAEAATTRSTRRVRLPMTGWSRMAERERYIRR